MNLLINFAPGGISLTLRRITGPGGACNPKITLPGAYKDTDTDIYISNFYYGFDPATFTAPGGAVATCT